MIGIEQGVRLECGKVMNGFAEEKKLYRQDTANE
jgi:hypothetical protein